MPSPSPLFLFRPFRFHRHRRCRRPGCCCCFFVETRIDSDWWTIEKIAIDYWLIIIEEVYFLFLILLPVFVRIVNANFRFWYQTKQRETGCDDMACEKKQFSNHESTTSKKTVNWPRFDASSPFGTVTIYDIQFSAIYLSPLFCCGRNGRKINDKAIGNINSILRRTFLVFVFWLQFTTPVQNA